MSRSLIALALLPMFHGSVIAQVTEPRRETTAKVWFSLDYAGGCTAPRRDLRPWVSILQDGTVLVPDNFGSGKTIKGKLAKSELRSLADLIMKKNGFVEIAARTDAEGRLAATAKLDIEDAADVVIHVHHMNKKATLRQLALDYALVKYPKNRDLLRLQAIASSLTRIRNITLLGGRRKADLLITTVNEKLESEHPGAEPFSLRHLVAVDRRGQGGLVMRIVHTAGRIETRAKVSLEGTRKPRIELRRAYVL